jgi:hypothetical protein
VVAGIRGIGVAGAATLLLGGVAVAAWRATHHDAPATPAPTPTPKHTTPSNFIAADGARLVRGGKPFRPFGFNDTTGGTGAAGEYFAHPTPAGLAQVRTDFADAKRLGANTMRVFLQLHDFVERGPDGAVHVRPDRIAAFRQVLHVAEQDGIALDVTGNLAWRPNSTPHWYDMMSNQQRWDVQSTFWRAVAGAAKDSPAVLCYELTSEPGVTSDTHGSWYGDEFGGFNFTQWIARGVPDAQAGATMQRWTRQLTAAIRVQDPDHLVGVGVLPFTGGPTSPTTLADDVDLLIYHDYPGAKIASNVATAKAFAAEGKPVLLGETSALNDDIATQERFLHSVEPYVAGTLSFYDGRDPEHMRVDTIADAMYQQNLRSYVGMRDELTSAS